MNKILRISVFMLLTLVSSLTFAKVIFDAKADKMQKKSITKDGVVVSVCKGELNNGSLQNQNTLLTLFRLKT